MECPAWEKPGSMHCLSELIKFLKTDLFPTRARKFLFAKGTFSNYYSKQWFKDFLNPENTIFSNDVRIVLKVLIRM